MLSEGWKSLKEANKKKNISSYFILLFKIVNYLRPVRRPWMQGRRRLGYGPSPELGAD